MGSEMCIRDSNCRSSVCEVGLVLPDLSVDGCGSDQYGEAQSDVGNCEGESSGFHQLHFLSEGERTGGLKMS